LRLTVDFRARSTSPSRIRGAILPACIALASVTGCAALSGGRATPAASASAAESERTLTELRAKNAAYSRRVTELENQVFVLEDQLAARRAADTARVPPKPSVHIVARRQDSVDAMSGVLARGRSVPETAPLASAQPPAGAAEREADARAVEDGGSSVVSDEDVEYGGEALASGRRASHRGSRVVLKLHGDRRASVAAAELAASPGGKATKARQMYRKALAALRAGKEKKGLAGFRRFVTKYPRHELADDAQYWIAECKYGQRDLAGADAEYRRVIEKYPQGNKVPDAMLKLGVTLLAEGEVDSGKRVLDTVARTYPEHEAGQAAAAQLAHQDEPPARGGQGAILGTVVPPAVAATGEARRP